MRCHQLDGSWHGEPSIVNIATFGECISILNPEVLAATIAAMGVLTPMPCVPVTVDPWLSGALNVMVTEGPALDQTATVMCLWAGVINIMEPGNITVQVP